ncbi:MAG: pantetheine-phosphate adenylyltransferase [Chloroflexota bacterium]
MYPGTFDPVHNGHLDIARRAARLFDTLIIAVYDKPAKSLLFSPEDRMGLLKQALTETDDCANVRVEGYSGLTVNYARRIGAIAIVRGLRAVTDFEYEYQMTTMNRHLEPNVETVLMMTSLKFAYLSSTIVKEVAAGGASLDGLVPPPVAAALASHFHGRAG